MFLPAFHAGKIWLPASLEQARDNLKEALELFFATASPEEIKQRLHGDVFVMQVEVAVG
jgi:predicted RNase H-like HicB family nuclease